MPAIWWFPKVIKKLLEAGRSHIEHLFSGTNYLLVSIKEADNVSTFKIRLKTFLFSQFYDY